MERVLRLGDSGPAVREVSDLLGRVGVLEGGARDAYDEAVERAVRTFQQQRGLTVDGAVGPSTFRRLDEARWRLGDRVLVFLPGRLMAGDDVVTLQQRLLGLGFRVGRADGFFGAETREGLVEFQRNAGLVPDGTCGPMTFQALSRLAPRVSGGSPNELRAQERIRRAGPRLAGKVVVVDPSLSGLPDALQTRAAAIVHDLAARIEGRLVAIGVQAFLAVPSSAQEPPDDADRAGFANRAGADLAVSVAVAAAGSNDVRGAATYFYGSAEHGVRSSTGERLASLVQRELVARTGTLDLRIHAKTWEFLRRTRMPAVRLEAGYLTNAEDRARLSDASFRDLVADAVVVAIQRFYLDPDHDSSTGVMRLSELRRLSVESAD